MVCLGSSEDPKDLSLHGMVSHGMAVMPSHMAATMATASADSIVTTQDNPLAKPVPMRRLSEKRIAQARASLGSISQEVAVGMPALSKLALFTVLI